MHEEVANPDHPHTGSPDRSRLAAILERMRTIEVAVVGDFCLDVYWELDRSRSERSLETGLATEPVRRERTAPGGAGNVVMNLLELGVKKVHAVGVLGEDLHGRELCRLLNHPEADTSRLIRQPEGWATQTFIKPMRNGVEAPRFDFGDFNELTPHSRDRLLEGLTELAGRVPVVIVNHQAKASPHNDPAFRKGLADLMSAHPEVTFLVDSRGYHEAYPEAVHKLNEKELLRTAGVDVAEDAPVALAEVVETGKALHARWGAPLVVTRGDRGCLVFDGGEPEVMFGVRLPGDTDPVGAGDTFVAALAAAVAAGASLASAAFAANLAASVTAGKLAQTGTASPGEILSRVADVDFVHRPELAESTRHARYFGDSEIEVVVAPPSDLRLRHAIFDHDGTISTLREGWEAIMEPMMMRAILGDALSTVDEALFLRVRERVRRFIDQTTGIQTIEQMAGLVDLVREFGVIPEQEILDAKGYKQIYNGELKAMVAERIAKLDRGELDVSDFILKGAVPFLKRLRTAGVRLYLASGTDDPDVKAEAERLGYADLFDGGIHGSLGIAARDAKRVVLERILEQVSGRGGTLAAFGDGPVEIRETVRRGGYAVGVASDEVRRFGFLDAKRSRLIRAGAHAVIPDFSQHERLWDFLGLPQG